MSEQKVLKKLNRYSTQRLTSGDYKREGKEYERQVKILKKVLKNRKNRKSNNLRNNGYNCVQN